MGGIRRAWTRSLNLAARSFGVDERATAAASGRSSSTFKTGVSDCFFEKSRGPRMGRNRLKAAIAEATNRRRRRFRALGQQG